MKIIVGLGNPGKEYENTRHNCGYFVVSFLRKKLEFDDFKMENKFKAELSSGELNGEKIILVKPMTFMNKSGDSVQNLVNFYKLDLKDLWVCYDDVDLPLGESRIREEGSAGTHNGMKSIIQSLGRQDFPRFRVGIESRGDLTSIRQTITDFVLNDFFKEERNKIDEVVVELAQKIIDRLNNK